VVVTPDTPEAVAETIATAARDGHTVVPVGGGRAASMGAPTDRNDLELSLAKLDRVVEHSQADLTCTVEAGITLERLQEVLGEAGQFLPLDPRNSPGHTVGGALASGWTGPLRMRFGSPREFVVGLRVALPDGSLVRSGGRVVKNVSGYDMNKLHLGALGTLGVIVEASFKLFPRPAAQKTLERTAKSADEAWAEVQRLLTLPQLPWALEVERDAEGVLRLVTLIAGPRSAVDRLGREIGWQESGESWDQRSRITSAHWAKIAAPRSDLPGILAQLPPGAHWIAQPATGTADWLDASDAGAVVAVRALAERAGGSLVLLAAPDELKREVGVWGAEPATLDLMLRLRDAFDPQRTINPGRYLV
jgi:glycolate dehydrogenase FAD-binding subunit